MSAESGGIEGAELTLVDYMAVIGFDVNGGLQPDPAAEAAAEMGAQSERSRPPMERPYLARVLQCWPSSREGFPFVSEVAALCMPKGLRFYTERKVPERQFHSFVLVKEDGTRVNGCAFTFYEQLLDTEIRQQMFDLHLDYIKEVTESETPDPAALHRQQRFGGQMAEANGRTMPGQVSHGNHTLPRNVSRRNVAKRTSYYDSTNKPIYAAKCLCIIQRLPVLFSAENILLSLWRSVFEPQSVVVDPRSLIFWSLHEVPLPLPGTALQCSYYGCDLAIRRPTLLELPFFDYSMFELFRLIPPDKFLKLFTCFLLEHQILLCSRRLDRLMLVAECLSALVFPFRWQLTYVPLLPFSQLKFIEAPVPYLMGFCYDDRIPDHIFQSNVCVVDIDGKRLDAPEDVPPFPKHRELCAAIDSLCHGFDETATVDGDAFARIPAVPAEEMAVGAEETNGMSPVKVVMRESAAAKRANAANRRGMIADESPTIAEPPPTENGVKMRPTEPPPTAFTLKRMSRSFDNADGMEAAFHDGHQSTPPLDEDSERQPEPPLVSTHKIQHYLNCLKFNNAIRELFLHHFIALFTTYEQFVIAEHSLGAAPKDENDPNGGGGGNRDSVVNFDRASFLSDQPDSFLPFLAAFLETQMFASFIDAKLISQWREGADENVALFDLRVRETKAAMSAAANRISVVVGRVPDFDVHSIPKPRSSFTYEVAPPHPIAGVTPLLNDIPPLNFPDFDSQLFEVPIAATAAVAAPASPWRQPNRNALRLAAELDEARIRMQSPRKRNPQSTSATPKPRRAAKTPAGQLAHRNWTFVEQLLKETKLKTKRLLLMKLGKEALQLGHNDSGVQGVEENTLVAGFCDLLDRVWAHGLKKKQGKSSLWANVLSFYEKNKFEEHRTVVKRHPNFSSEQWRKDEEEPEDKGALADLLDQFRAITSNFGDDLTNANTATGPQWSTSLLRVANFISDKITATTGEESPTMPRESRSRQENPNVGGRRSASTIGQRREPSVQRTAPPTQRPPPPPPLSPNAALPPSGNQRPPLSDRRDANANPMSPNALPKHIHKSSSVSDFAPEWTEKPHPPMSAREHSTEHYIAGSNPPTPTHHSRSRRTNSRQPPTSHERKRSLSRPRSPVVDPERNLPPLPTHIGYDLRNVLRMTEIKTDIGFARAFVRLSLERKLLHSHLKAILSDRHLLRELYKRYAFLRSEEEREQFLYHCLSLNAVDFSCFTHTFISTRIQYEVLFVGTLDRFNSAAVWIMCSGTLGATQLIGLPPNSLQFSFEHKNLGLLTTLRVGHSRGGERISKWFLDYVIVRNNITAQSFRFNCGRSFGRSVEDGALERVLVAEPIRNVATAADDSPVHPTGPQNVVAKFMSSSMLQQLGNGGVPSRPQSPAGSVVSDVGGGDVRHGRSSRSASRSHHQREPSQNRHGSISGEGPQYNYYSARSNSQTPQHRSTSKRSASLARTDSAGPPISWEPRLNELQHKIGEAVNALVKHFYSATSRSDAASLTVLLCGERGLVAHLETVFTMGRRDTFTRFFRQSYPWDYIEKCFIWWANYIRTPAGNRMGRDERSVIIYAYDMVKKIAANGSVGKEGKFQAFLLLTLRDHQLAGLLPLLAFSEVTRETYDESSILRQPPQLNALGRLLSALHEFNITLEKSLTYGIGF